MALDFLDPFNDNSLVAKYLFEDNANDEFTNYNGSLVGSIVFGTLYGHYDKGINFSASNAYTSFPIFTGLFNGTSTSSIAFYITDVGALNTNSLPFSFSADNGDRGLIIVNGAIGIQDTNNSSKVWTNLSQGFTLTDGCHVVVTKNQNVIKVYIDGTLSSTTTPNQADSTVDNRNSVGAYHGTCAIDHLEIFNRTLSDAEVTTLYNRVDSNILDILSTDPFNDVTLLAQYRLENNINDSVSTNHGSVIASPSYVQGAYNLGLEVDDVNKATLAQFPNQFNHNSISTISMYIKEVGDLPANTLPIQFASDLGYIGLQVIHGGIFSATGLDESGSLAWQNVDFSPNHSFTLTDGCHVVVTKYGRVIRIYIDGVLITACSEDDYASLSSLDVTGYNEIGAVSGTCIVDHVEVFGVQLSFENIQKLTNRINPITVDAEVVDLTTEILQLGNYVDGVHPQPLLTTLSPLDVIINTQRNVSVSADIVELTLTSNIVKAGELYIKVEPVDLQLNPLNIIQHADIESEISYLTLDVLEPLDVGSVIHSIIKPQLMQLSFTPLPIKAPLNTTIIVDILSLNMILDELPKTITVNPSTLVLSTKFNEVVINPQSPKTSRKRVIKIGDIGLPKAMYWDGDLQPYISSSETTENANTIHFVSPLKQFTQNFTISSDETMSLSYDKVLELNNMLSEDVFVIYFNDGSSLEAKFNLLNKALSATPIFDGQDSFYLDLKVLI